MVSSWSSSGPSRKIHALAWMIAGLEDISGGEIPIGSRGRERRGLDRGTAMVPELCLYPHMTVAQNLSFGLRMNGNPAADTERRVAEAARILRIEPLLTAVPRVKLPGGQRQRRHRPGDRAQARGASSTHALSNLDAELRVQMRIEIARLHSELGTTMIYVTHDQTEAMTMADRIVVLRAGRVEQIGAPPSLRQSGQPVCRGLHRRLDELAAESLGAGGQLAEPGWRDRPGGRARACSRAEGGAGYPACRGGAGQLRSCSHRRGRASGCYLYANTKVGCRRSGGGGPQRPCGRPGRRLIPAARGRFDPNGARRPDLRNP